MFWEYKEILFNNQNRLSDAQLKSYAGDLSLDQAAFDACLDSGDKASRVQEDLDSAQALGVRGTPSFVIDGMLHLGFKTEAQFAALLDAALADAGG
jgi:predicted DsbA family dithiol-disulfide isomerase